MDRKTMEKYLKLYPEIDSEIEKRKEELKFYQSQRERIINLNMSKEYTDSLLENINTAFSSCANELQEMIEAKIKIDRALNIISPVQKEIIKCRFWKAKGRPTPWEDVADELCYHRVHVLRLYKDALNKMVS